MTPLSPQEFAERWNAMGQHIPSEPIGIFVEGLDEPIDTITPVKWQLIRVPQERLNPLPLPADAKAFLRDAGLPRESIFEFDFRLLDEGLIPLSAFDRYVNKFPNLKEPYPGTPSPLYFGDFYAVGGGPPFVKPTGELKWPGLLALEAGTGKVWLFEKAVDDRDWVTFSNSDVASLATFLLLLNEMVFRAEVDQTNQDEVADHIIDHAPQIVRQMQTIDPAAFASNKYHWPVSMRLIARGGY